MTKSFTDLIQAHSEGHQLQRKINRCWCNITIHQLEEYHHHLPSDQFRAVPTDKSRYRWLAAYLVSDRQDVDDAIVEASTIDELSSIIDKEMADKRLG